ncbi:MAG: PDZ domain-containing protein, partial [Candidatus Thermoplasmatota archaeon]|nr:PDZ domain-containing protein [Candidatus Thermoplasmatota archaeon]
TKTLAEKVVDYTISAKRKGLLFKASGNNLHILTIDDKESETKFKDDREIDPRKVRITVLPEMEWKQIFLEAWRLACENHWNPDFVKKNGEKILKKYADLEERVTTRFELSDILREMQGEFGTSHSYEMGGDLSSVKAVITGKLGADLSLSDHGYRIDRIYSGDPFNDNEKSPLISANAGIEEGDVVVSVDSVKLDEEHSPYKELLNRAGDLILMEFLKKNGKKIKAYVRPLNDERYLRYRSWVEEKRKYVHEKTGNRIGYVHIPDMGLMGYTEFYRLFLMESSYDGLIVDIRYNGGGHVSQLLLEKVARTRLGYDKPRRGKLGPYPGNSVNGPRVAITNEYAGSDGDVFGQAFKMLELGPLIGTRSWGGVVGINPRERWLMAP